MAMWGCDHKSLGRQKAIGKATADQVRRKNQTRYLWKTK